MANNPARNNRQARNRRREGLQGLPAPAGVRAAESRVHRTGDYVHGKVCIAVPFDVSSIIREWEYSYPGYTLVGRGGVHAHPWSAAERALTELVLCQSADQHVSDVNVVMHIGGSEKRLSKFRPHDHVCAPILTATDRLRTSGVTNYRLVGNPAEEEDLRGTVCRKAAPHDHQHRAGAFVLHHSGYYLLPADYRRLGRWNQPIYVGAHRFNGSHGSLCHGEADWERREGQIHMNVRGNIHTYVHDDFFDTLRTLMTVPIDGQVFAAEIYREFGDTALVRMVMVPETLPRDLLHLEVFPNHEVREIAVGTSAAIASSAVQSDWSVESLGVQAAPVSQDQANQSDRELVGLSDQSTQTGSDDLFQTEEWRKKTAMFVWDSPVDREADLKIWRELVVNGKAYFATTVRDKTCLDEVSRWVYRHSSFKRMTLTGKSAHLRIVDDIWDDNIRIAMRAVEWDTSEQRRLRANHALGLELKAPWSWEWKVLLVFACLYAFIGVACSVWYFSEYLTAAGSEVLLLLYNLWTIISGLVATLASWFMTEEGPKPTFLPGAISAYAQSGDDDSDWWILWIILATLLGIVIMYLIHRCMDEDDHGSAFESPLLGTNSRNGQHYDDECFGGQELKPLKTGATFSPAEVSKNDCRPGQGFWGIGWVSVVPPVVSRKCTCNEEIAVRNRVVQETQALDRGTVEEFRKWVKLNASKLFNPVKIAEPDFHEWISHMDRSKKDRFIEARQKMVESPTTTSSVFIKRELLAPNLDANPRVITNRDAAYQVEVGPTIYAIQKHFKEQWNVDSDMGFTSGWSPEDLSLWYERNRQKTAEQGEYLVVENDFSRFDATIRPELLAIEQEIYAMFGISPKVRKLLQAQLKTRGWTPNGGYFSVPGTRKSGDSNTSLGNTILNILITKYIFEVMLKSTIRVMAVGDDSVVLTNLDRNTCEKVPALYALFGLKATSKIHASDSFGVEYCSGLFYPTRSGFAFGPKPGRVLNKLGFTTKQHKRLEQEKYLRGTLLDKQFDYAPIPVLGVAAARLYNLLDCDAKIDTSEFKVHSSRMCPWPDYNSSELYSLMAERYGCSVSGLREVEELYLRTPLGSVVDHPILRRMICIDCDITEEQLTCRKARLTIGH